MVDIEMKCERFVPCRIRLILKNAKEIHELWTRLHIKLEDIKSCYIESGKGNKYSFSFKGDNLAPLRKATDILMRELDIKPGEDLE